MSEGFPRLPTYFALTVLAAVSPAIDRAQAQFFPGFGAPQQINTARGAIQLAPGWHVATTPVRAGQGYRVAVRSDYGEQRNMFIGANGALSVENAQRAPSRPLMKIERSQRKVEAQKPKTKVAVIRSPGKPQGSPVASPQNVKPVSVPAQQSNVTKPLLNDASRKWQAPDSSAPQAPGFAHGVPINPLD